jgi:hypothetical protein
VLPAGKQVSREAPVAFLDAADRQSAVRNCVRSKRIRLLF